MTLQASGQITFTDINGELGTSSYTSAEADMDTMTALAFNDSTITNEPDNTADWYSYEHLLGRMYGQNVSTTLGGYIKRVTIGSTHHLPTSHTENLEYTALTVLHTNVENTRIDGDASGTAFVAFSDVEAWLYRRDKQSTDSWVEVSHWAAGAYLSQAVSCDYDTYDYKWKMSTGTT